MEPIIGFLIILLINVLVYAVIFFSTNSTFKEKEKGLRGQIDMLSATLAERNAELMGVKLAMEVQLNDIAEKKDKILELELNLAYTQYLLDNYTDYPQDVEKEEENT